MPAKPRASLDRLLVATAACFDRSPQSASRQPWELPALLVILVLAGAVRFWGLGSWGLEYDEETMAMPTMHIVAHGSPILPSGMTYVRGIAQLYLMAASVGLFGESEWAFRLPSVLCGLVLIVIAYFFGRRFLRPICNIGLVATVGFLPAFIADSQEARMYIFMLTCLAGYGVLIFRWEQTGVPGYLAAAVLAMIVGLQFHTLTVFGAFLVFLPGVLHGDAKKLWQGLAAFCCIVVAFVAINGWVESFYPPRPATQGAGSPLLEHARALNRTRMSSWIVLVAASLAAMLSVYATRSVRTGLARIALTVVVLLGLIAQLAFFNHAGLLLLIGGAVALSRRGETTLTRLVPVATFSALILATEYYLLAAAGIGDSRKILGAMVGLPSIWPALRMAQYSPPAALIAIACAASATWRFAHGRHIPDYWLLFVLAVWMPLFLLGFFSWDVETRYTEFALLPLLICAIAPFQEVGAGQLARFAIAAVVCLVVVNPLASARVINAGYTIHPDHKGAAEFIRSIGPGPNDLLLAEDVNQQTYYLGHVDFWLIGQEIADHFSQRVNGQLRDIYTGTAVLSTVPQLNALLCRPERGAIYVIGSGEDQEDHRRAVRGAGLDDALHSPVWEIVYSGRDALTKVWKARPLQQRALPLAGC